MKFDWDDAKAAAHLEKHGVSFEEAVTIFADRNALDGRDVQHSFVEPRRLRVGCSGLQRVLTVAYAMRSSGSEETIRIISARRASRKERHGYFSPQD